MLDKCKLLHEDCVMTNQTAGRNHHYDRAQLTSVIVAETSANLLRETFVADRALSKVKLESRSPEAYSAAEAVCRDTRSRFYGFLIRFAAARLGDDNELAERSAHYSARLQRSHERLEASRPEWFTPVMQS
jgi:hypothetical protein